MDAAVDNQKLVEKIEEAIKAGLTSLEGSKLVGIYDDGYRTIEKLIMLRERHRDPVVRNTARKWLDKINLENGLGSNLTYIQIFLGSILKKGKVAHSWRKLSEGNNRPIDIRLKELLERNDIEEKVKDRVKELIESIVSEKIMSHLYTEALKILKDYRSTKDDIAKKQKTSDKYVHAVEMACGLCDNLAHIEKATVAFSERKELSLKINSAVATLLEVQREIIEGERE